MTKLGLKISVETLCLRPDEANNGRIWNRRVQILADGADTC